MSKRSMRASTTEPPPTAISALLGLIFGSLVLSAAVMEHICLMRALSSVRVMTSLSPSPLLAAHASARASMVPEDPMTR